MAEQRTRIEQAHFRTTRLLASLGLCGLIGYALFVVADVLLRYLFAAPIDGAQEIGKLLVAIVVAAFFPSSLAERQHITIDLVLKRLGARARRGFQAFGALVTLVFFGIVGWRFVLYTAELQRSGETTWILGWSVAPWWAVATLFLVACVPVQVFVFREFWRALFRCGSRSGHSPDGVEG